MDSDAALGLPADDHVHSQWSWDAPGGDMEASCRRALEVGLPSISFTEHVDHTVWRVHRESLSPDDPLLGLFDATGDLHPPALDVAGYLDSVERCRDLFPALRIRTGVELGEPHRHAEEVRVLLDAGDFDRVLGSLHSLPIDDHHSEPPEHFARRDPDAVLADYLAEIATLADSTLDFEVLAHIDYPLRSWPEDRVCDLARHEDAFRAALSALARSGRALELNTRLPVSPLITTWWHEEGGEAVTFGSDAHRPEQVARDFGAALAIARACGFAPGSRLDEPWGRA